MRFGLLVVISVGIVGSPALLRADETVFEQRIAPVLRAQCLSCHSEKNAKGGLDLSSRTAALRGGDKGEAIVPGKPDDSVLLEMVAGAKPKMPKNGKPLSPEQVADLKQWIAGGAAWPDKLKLEPANRSGTGWWAYQQPRRPPLPSVKRAGWVRTPVDAFILAKLEEKGLTPSPAADRVTLIRRLSFDLIGLLPTPDEVDAFVSDAAPNAFEKLVDRLLASPHYGERWGRLWLDTAHFADTHGYDKDQRRPNAWPYRDYVIRAFNLDKPYDRFIREQLAGDVLFPNDPQATTATGFIAAGPWDLVGQTELREGTVDKEITRLLDRDDMVTNTSNTFLSMTVGCARCHDHKFDPIAQHDYYRLQAVFAGIERGDRQIAYTATPDELATREQQKKSLQARIAELNHDLEKALPPDVAVLEGTIQTVRDQLAALPKLAPQQRSNGWHSQISGTEKAKVWVQVDLGKSLPIDEIRLYPARPVDFPDTPGFGFPAQFKVQVANESTFATAETVADYDRANFPNPGDLPYAIPVMGKTARYVRLTATRFWKRTADYVVAVAEMEVDSAGKNVAHGAAVTASDSIEAGLWSTKNLVDGYTSRAVLPDLADPKTGAEARKRLELQLRLGGLQRERQVILDRTGPDLKKKLAEVQADLAKLNAPPTQACYTVLPRAPRPIHVLHRGDVKTPKGALVAAGSLSLVKDLETDFKLDHPEQEGERRALLAEWVASPKNPLTWRSLVNRVWANHFGKGIVDTPNDFGFNGGPPSHPELLDWLAVEFRDGGRSIKGLHRLLVTSAAYRQATRPDAAAAKLDGDNRLLWRMNRRRLDAESLRDAVLQASGRLDPRMYGPGFDLFWFKHDHSPTYDYARFEKEGDHPEANRRTVYRFVVRSVPNPFLECLDAADPNLSTPVRNTTNTALQALALLNDPFMVRQAKYLADRLATVPGGLPARVEAACRLTLGRKPAAAEADALIAYAEQHGLPQLCRVLFNTNEFLFVD